ncbi:MAG TPA: FAD-dependent oxidoreductase [Deltaproteobacteria bacterium]|nr:FAD-dependent oxidoreductase [Deltaproteobacteria bacterium]
MFEIPTHLNKRFEAGVARGKAIAVKINGVNIRAHEGESIGAVLTASGVRKIRYAPHPHDPRGLYCGMGSCYGCLVTVGGQPNIRACVTPVESGMEITLQDGFGKFTVESTMPVPAESEQFQIPLVIVGGGPAGLSAAIAAARFGIQVLVIDENCVAGGQIYRQLPPAFKVEQASKLGADYADGRMLLKQAADLSQFITIWNDALVWSVFESNQLAVERNNKLILIHAKAVIVATGAYERPFPVEGWTLPGVMTVGGAQTLLKSQRILPGNRVLLAGTGPLQLVVADQMLDAGMKIVAVAESVSHLIRGSYIFDLIRQPGLMFQGLKYLMRLKRESVPLLKSSVLAGIEGRESVVVAVVERIDDRLNRVPGTRQVFEVDTVCIGYGLIPNTWLTHMLGCRHEYDALTGCWAPVSGNNMETDKPGIFVAGDGAGVAGVLVATCEGAIAGLFAGAHAGGISTADAERAARPVRKKLSALRKFRHAMDRIYMIEPDLYSDISDDTIICRCEGVTAGEIRDSIRKGTLNPNDIKKRTRAGMGYCQGTNCFPTIAMILMNEFDVVPEALPWMTTRPPARPIPLSLLVTPGVQK